MKHKPRWSALLSFSVSRDWFLELVRPKSYAKCIILKNSIVFTCRPHTLFTYSFRHILIVLANLVWNALAQVILLPQFLQVQACITEPDLILPLQSSLDYSLLHVVLWLQIQFGDVLFKEGWPEQKSIHIRSIDVIFFNIFVVYLIACKNSELMHTECSLYI